MKRNFGSWTWSSKLSNIGNQKYNISNINQDILDNILPFDYMDNIKHSKLDEAGFIIQSWKNELEDKIKAQRQYIDHENQLLNTPEDNLRRSLMLLRLEKNMFSKKKSKLSKKKKSKRSKAKKSKKRSHKSNKFGRVSVPMYTIVRETNDLKPGLRC